MPKSSSPVLAAQAVVLLFAKAAGRAHQAAALPARESHADWRHRLGQHWPLLCFAVCAVYSLAGSMIGWMNPLLDAHGFRQTQTAMSVWTMLNGGPLVAYETPVMGPPWSMPYEFPLFQWMVAAVVKVSQVNLDQAGRFVSLLMFWLALIPGYRILSVFRLSRNQRLLILSIIVVSPFYIFWSRAFMIESTALLLSLAFLAAAESFLRTGRWSLAFLAAVFGALAASVKITSFAVYLGALALIVLHRRLPDRANGRGWIRDGLTLAIFGFVCLGPALAWTRYADSLKAQNPIAEFTTTAATTNWNFGTLQQRFSWQTWSQVLNFSCVVDYHWALFATAAAGAVLARRRWAQIAVCVLLYFSAPLVFTNLHRVHWYYAYPNLVFLLLAVGLTVVALLEQADWRRYLGMTLLASTIVFSVYRHQASHAALQSLNRWPTMAAAAALARVTEPDEIVIIYGQEWSSEIPYYARRRALMLPSFLTSEAAARAFGNLAGYKIGALLVVTDGKVAAGWYPDSPNQAILAQLREFGLSATASFYDNTIKIFPPGRFESAYENLDLARREMAKGNFLAAEKALTAAIDEQPNDPNLFEQRALCRLSQQKPTECLADFDDALRLNPVDPAFYADHAVALLKVHRRLLVAVKGRPGLLDPALSSIDRAIATDAYQPRFFQIREQIHLSHGEKYLAEQDQNKANALLRASDQ